MLTRRNLSFNQCSNLTCPGGDATFLPKSSFVAGLCWIETSNNKGLAIGQKLTILGADSEQVDDVLVFVHHLHQLHFGDEVRKIFVSGVI